MPLIRCPRCNQPYDVPAAVAVKLPSSIAKCHCGEWLCGNKEALINRVLGDGELLEIDVSRYRVEESAVAADLPMTVELDPFDLGQPRSVRIVARSEETSINIVYSVDRNPLYIGRMGCHVELDDSELSIRHCEIVRRGSDLLLRDLDSHTGTFLDGEQVGEAVIAEGTHLVRIGGALICVEPVDEPGELVGPIELGSEELLGASPLLMKKLAERGARAIAPVGQTRLFIVCTEGPCAGQEFEVPSEGGIVGREGSVRVPDEYLSRKHFSFFRHEDGTLRIKDLGSRNGTFLNTLPARDTKVHNGDEIRAGFSVFRIEERQLTEG